MAIQLPSLGPRTRVVVRYLGFFLLTVVTFVFALQMTFPYNRVKAKITEVLSEKYDVSMGDVERGIMPGRVSFKSVSLKTRPTQADLDRVAKIEDPKERDTQRALLVTTIFIERLEIDLSILALIRGTASVDLDAKIGAGHITGNIAISKKGTSVDLEGSDLPSGNLPMREAFSGLPMGGKVNFSVALELPNEKTKAGKSAPNWSKAEGAVMFQCPANCTIGDSKAKFHPKLTGKNAKNEATVKDGIKFGTINVDSLLAKVEVKKGVLEITKFDLASRDVELHLEMTMNLEQDLTESMVAGCARYKATDALLKRESSTHSAFMLIGGPLGPDGLFHVKLDGPFKTLRKLASVCGPAANTAMDDPGGNNKPSNPRLAPPPPEDSKPSVPPPPPIAVPADAPPAQPLTSDAIGAGSASAGSGTGPAGSGSGHDDHPTPMVPAPEGAVEPPPQPGAP